MGDKQPSRYFEIGRIVNTQGLRGCVRVMPMTFDPTRFELLDSVVAADVDNNITLEIDSVSYHKQFVILKFRGIDDMDSAARLKNRILRIPEELALPLAEDEYYIGDLIGLSVRTVEGEVLGDITDVQFTGANDVYTVRCINKKEILIPAIKECVIDVDVGNGIMTVRLLEGLR